MLSAKRYYKAQSHNWKKRKQRHRIGRLILCVAVVGFVYLAAQIAIYNHLLLLPPTGIRSSSTDQTAISLFTLRENGWKVEKDRHFESGGARDHHVDETCEIPIFRKGSLFPLNQSGCFAFEVTDSSHNISHCAFSRLRIDPSKVSSIAHGGEPLDQVMGQQEEAELLRYQPGAFISYGHVDLKRMKESISGDQYYVHDVLENMIAVSAPSLQDKEWVNACPPTPTSSTSATAALFIQRYEYANLYHAMTDIWNTWEVYRQIHPRDSTSKSSSVRVVFLDAHPHGLLDDVWSTLFGRVDRINDLLHGNNGNATTCFPSAYLIPPGYVSRLIMDVSCKDHRVMREFVHFVLDRFNLGSVKMIPGRVSIIDRQAFVAHPRQKPVSSRTLRDMREIDNLDQVGGWIQDRLRPRVSSVRILPLHNMTFREQLRAIRESEVLIGFHGAGLTHLLFLDEDKGTHVVEWDWDGLELFHQLNDWKGRTVAAAQKRYHLLEPPSRGTITRDYFDGTLLPALSGILDT